LKFIVDNSKSEVAIDSITVTLKQITCITKISVKNEIIRSIERDIMMIDFGDLNAGANSGQLTAQFDIKKLNYFRELY
jgi:hypothetical protein